MFVTDLNSLELLAKAWATWGWVGVISKKKSRQLILCLFVEEASSSKGRNGNFEPQRRRPELDPPRNTEPDQYVLLAHILWPHQLAHKLSFFMHFVICRHSRNPTVYTPQVSDEIVSFIEHSLSEHLLSFSSSQNQLSHACRCIFCNIENIHQNYI